MFEVYVQGQKWKVNKMCKLETLINAIDQKFLLMDKEKVKQAEKSLNLDFTELISFQNLKSRAQLKGILDLETSMFIYKALGDWDNQTIGTKFILTKLHADLLKKSIAGVL